jgi:hypothetical protein
MGQFRSKFPGYVDRAVREAVAAKKRPKDILAGLRAGTLPGLEGRTVQIADRTFYRKLADARAKLKAEPAKREGPSLRVRLLLTQREMPEPEELRSLLEADGTDPEAIDAAVEELRQHKLAEQRDRDERDRIKALACAAAPEGPSRRLRQLAAQKETPEPEELTAEQTVQEIREATGLSWRELHNRFIELQYRYSDELTEEEREALWGLSVTADKLRGQPKPVRPGDYDPRTRQ